MNPPNNTNEPLAGGTGTEQAYIPFKKRRMFQMSEEALPVIVSPVKASIPEVVKPPFQCNCPTRTKSDDFCIHCDYCKDWYHGSCHGMTLELSEKIHKWACSICQKSFMKPIAWKVKCARAVCLEYARDLAKENDNILSLSDNASKYCSQKCGIIIAKERLYTLLKDIPKKKRLKTRKIQDVTTCHSTSITNLKQDHHPMKNNRLHEIQQLGLKKRMIRSRVSQLELCLLNTDDIIENTFLYNNSKPKEERICGFDSRITLEWKSDSIVRIIMEVDGNTIASTQCSNLGKCSRHDGWQRLKTRDVEIEIEYLTLKYAQLRDYKRLLESCKE